MGTAKLHSVFAYGTLVFPEVMAALTGRQLPHRKAVLPGYRCSLVRAKVYPAVVPEPKAMTAGVVYEGVLSSSLELLDRFEGDRYRREAVTVQTDDGASCQAWAYVLVPERRAELSDQPWDPSAFASRHLADYTVGCRAFRIEEGRR